MIGKIVDGSFEFYCSGSLYFSKFYFSWSCGRIGKEPFWQTNIRYQVEFSVLWIICKKMCGWFSRNGGERSQLANDEN
jgi:hypothetical protein